MNLLGTQQAADKLGVSVRRILALIYEGKLAAQQIGREYVIQESALANVTIYGKPGRPKKTDEAEAIEVTRESAPVNAKTKKAKTGAAETKPTAKKRDSKAKGK
ncbi:MAG: helix-turn-helix domain-containing protein [Acidobacteria bacterium]|nr:helix-turn-helix domain-containing protein [Acidobacteriota bacterium]MBI3428003.1 helix-turn-helix domain-containing protein [Acidobacteriota bacterium]